VEIEWVIDTLIEIWKCWRDSFEPRDRAAKGGRPAVKKGDRVLPNSYGTPGTIAAHGYLNLPPELVAALVGTDGSDLKWLGLCRIKDMMHFEYNPSHRLCERGL
jgi:hypothetical protein